MSDNCWIGITGVTLYVGDKEISYATLGDKLIFPMWEGTYKVGYTGSGTIQILNNSFNLDKIVYMQIGDIQMYPQTTYDFSGQTKEVIWKVKTSSSSYVEKMFAELVSVTGVTAMSGTDRILPMQFQSCPNLVNVSLSNVTFVESGAFWECSGITGNVDLSQCVVIADYAFYKCSNITGITAPNLGTVALYACSQTGLRTLTVPSTMRMLMEGCFLWTPITALTIQNGVTYLPDMAFKDTEMKDVTIPDSVQTLGSSTFGQCIYLTGVTIGSGVTSIGNGCFMETKISSITLPPSLTSLAKYAFMDCTNLNTIYLNTTNTVDVHQYAFINVSPTGTFYYHEGTDISGFINATVVGGWTFIPY